MAMGAVIDSAEPDMSVVSLELSDIHRNASGGIMGGVAFTLADFAFSVASNQEDHLVVSVSSTIEYVGMVKGTRLIARARPDRIGKSLCFYTIEVEDDLGNLVAVVTMIGKHTSVLLDMPQ